MSNKIWAETALTADGWAAAVELEVDSLGYISAVSPDRPYRDASESAC